MGLEVKNGQILQSDVGVGFGGMTLIIIKTAKTDMRTLARSVSEEDLRAARAARKRQTSTAESDQACRKVLTKSRSESDILADEAAAQTCSHLAMRVARLLPVRFLESSVTAIEQPKRLQHDHAPTDDHHLAVTRMSQSAPRRKRAERAAFKIQSEMRSPPPTPRGRLSPLLSP